METNTAPRLNFDIVQTICSYLKPEDLLNCKIVSPLFESAAVYNLERNFKHFVLDIDVNKFATFETILEALEHIGPSLKQLTVGMIRTKEPDWRLTLSEFYQILRMCPKLETLHLQDEMRFIDKGLSPPDLSFLRKLTFSICHLDESLIGQLLDSCSDQLQTLYIFSSDMTGDCLKQAPVSVRDLRIHTSIDNHLDHIIAYTDRNPNLEVLELIEYYYLDLGRICSNLKNLQRLTLYCTQFSNFRSLATLHNLTTLAIEVRNEQFCEYPLALTAAPQQLKTLQLFLYDMDITNQMAMSFQYFRKLFILELHIAGSVQNHNLLLTYLENLPNLEHVKLTGIPFDFDSICDHLPQVKTLRVSVTANCEDPNAIRRLKQLEELDIRINRRMYRSIPTNERSRTINQFIIAVCASTSVHTLTLRTSVKTDLHLGVLFALQTATSLKNLHLYCVFYAEQAMQLLRNAPHLINFRQYCEMMFTCEEVYQLRSIRPGQLNVILDPTTHITDV